MNRIACVAAMVALLIAGCGDEESPEGGNGDDASTASSECLTPQEVQQQINEIAKGYEVSDADVAAKQEQIMQIQSREC